MPNYIEENYTLLPAYVINQAKNIITRQITMRNDLITIDQATQTSRTIGQISIVEAITPEMRAKTKQSVFNGYRADVQKTLNSTKETLDTMRKAAIQEYYKAKPRPTDIERGEILSLVKEYRDSNEPNKEQTFKERRTYHIQNETVEALIYILAGKELGIGVDPSEFEIEMPKFNYGIAVPAPSAVQEVSIADQFKGTDMGRALKIHKEIERAAKVQRQIEQHEKYFQSRINDHKIDPAIQFQTDQLLMKLCPALKSAQFHIDCVTEAERLFEILGFVDKIFVNSLNAGGMDHANGETVAKLSTIEIYDIHNVLISLGCNSNGLFDLCQKAATSPNYVGMVGTAESVSAQLTGELIGYVVGA